MVRRRRSNASRISSAADRSPDTAARAAACDTLDTFDVMWLCRFAAAAITSSGPIIPPTGHRVRLGHPVQHHGPVRQRRRLDRDRRELRVAVYQVLVNFIGDHPEA